jgi:hypothetical protein
LGADILKLYTSYRGDRFQVPTRQTGEYKVDVTCHPKFPLAFRVGEQWFPTLPLKKLQITRVVLNNKII